jgi:hypothetical protein
MLLRIVGGCALGLAAGALGFVGCAAATSAPQVTQVAVIDLEARLPAPAATQRSGSTAATQGPAPPGASAVASTAEDEETPDPEQEAEPSGARSKGEEGSMGAADSGQQQYGMIGLLGSSNADAGSLASVFGAGGGIDQALAGGLVGAPGDSFGAGGLGLSGMGTGAGGTGQGIGLGSIGTIGHGAGTGTGQGFGSGAGRLGSSRKQSPSQIRLGATTVTGSLPPEVIQRIVRTRLAQFRYCYEKALVSKPTLRGRVATRFVIGKDGSVVSAQDAGSDLKDASVKACVQSRFRTMSFPSPKGGGVVVVVYPLLFQPGEPEAPAKKASPSRAPTSAPPAATPASSSTPSSPY